MCVREWKKGFVFSVLIREITDVCLRIRFCLAARVCVYFLCDDRRNNLADVCLGARVCVCVCVLKVIGEITDVYLRIRLCLEARKCVLFLWDNWRNDLCVCFGVRECVCFHCGDQRNDIVGVCFAARKSMC